MPRGSVMSMSRTMWSLGSGCGQSNAPPYERERVRIAKGAGRRFSSPPAEMAWPLVDFERYLRGGHSALSLGSVHRAPDYRASIESVPHRRLLP